MYTTKTTWLGNAYGCRVFFEDVPIVESKCVSREMIGPTFRDLFRTLDKLGGDKFTSASRKRKFKEGNQSICVKHKWLKY